MPTINPALVPTIAPGNIFNRFTTDNTLNVRWLTALDPVYYEVQNRPMADITLRQLIIAKALDSLNLSLGHEALYPFVIPPKVIVSNLEYALPTSWIWDIHESLPSSWKYIRLHKIMRISGSNGSGSESGPLPTGLLRFVFSGQLLTSTQEP